MKAKLIKVLEHYHLYDGDKAIATTIVGNPMLLPNLSLKNCEAIERGYDIELLSIEYASRFKDDNGTSDVDFMMGFLKALEILGDKKFSEDDVVDAFNTGIQQGKLEERGARDLEYDSSKEYIQSLQQPTEIIVEIVMEKYGYCEGCRKAGMWHCAHADTCGYAETRERPKLDSHGCLVLIKL